jgi:hypothetical protein
MKKTNDNSDLFCRVNIQSELPHNDFVNLIADCVGGQKRWNSVTSDSLDISVDSNDVYDAGKCRAGKDRWLYFKYTLEIDPIGDVSSQRYVESIAAFLETLWAKRIEAVASCEFEELLPRNFRRMNWEISPRSETDRV